MPRKGLFIPKLHDRNVRRLYHHAHRFSMPVSQLLNLIVSVGLEELSWLTDKTYQARSMSYVYIGPMEGRRVHPDACHRASMVPQALSSLRRNHGEHTLSV